MSDSAIKDSLIVCQNSHGVELRATLLRLTRFVAVFEVYSPASLLRTSEVLSDFRIVINERAIYSGRAVVSNIVSSGSVTVCEVKLDESQVNIAGFAPLNGHVSVADCFNVFLSEWQKVYKILPEFKVVVADMQTFLADMRLWLDQVELEFRSHPDMSRGEREIEFLDKLGQPIVPAFNAIHERMEDLSEKIDEDLRPIHQSFAKRQLHPLVLCSPFAYRTYHKPLGYAGDYEMVNMITRSPYEGSSLFAKMVNLWFLSQYPSVAHRNRIKHLKGRLVEECARAARNGKPLRILNMGCGPAVEIQEFLAENSLADHAQFTLLDFIDETIQHTQHVLEQLQRNHGRRTQIKIQKKSVHHILKESARPSGEKYDYVYCAGLFDYLSDRTCKQLMNIFYSWLVPGGLLVATNVEACKPFRHMLEFVLDWQLIYRNEAGGAKLIPDAVPAGAARITKDVTEVNIFIEVRKPENG